MKRFVVILDKNEISHKFERDGLDDAKKMYDELDEKYREDELTSVHLLLKIL